MPDSDLPLKVLMLGESGVGKTCLIRRWKDDGLGDITPSLKNMQTTAGVDFVMKALEVDGKRVKVNVWDTAGQERYHSITKSVVRKAQGIVLVYDITDKQSYERVNGWLRDILDFCGDELVKIVLVGNKCDLLDKRAVQIAEGQDFANRHELPFFETSAIANIKVDEVFMTVARNIIRSRDSLNSKSSLASKQSLSLGSSEGGEKKSRGCC